MKFMDTSIPQEYNRRLFKEKNMEFPPEHTDKICYVLLYAVSEILSTFKDKQIPVSYEFYNNDRNKFIAAAIVQYIPNEDDNMPGSWSLVWTFYEKDIPRNAKRINLNDESLHVYFRSVAGSKFGIRFKNGYCLVTMMTFLLDVIKKWLDNSLGNATDLTIELEGVMKAKVALEDNEKVFSIIPSAEVKAIIKDDAAIET